MEDPESDSPTAIVIQENKETEPTSGKVGQFQNNSPCSKTEYKEEIDEDPTIPVDPVGETVVQSEEANPGKEQVLDPDAGVQKGVIEGDVCTGDPEQDPLTPDCKTGSSPLALEHTQSNSDFKTESRVATDNTQKVLHVEQNIELNSVSYSVTNVDHVDSSVDVSETVTRQKERHSARQQELVTMVTSVRNVETHAQKKIRGLTVNGVKIEPLDLTAISGNPDSGSENEESSFSGENTTYYNHDNTTDHLIQVIRMVHLKCLYHRHAVMHVSRLHNT